MIFLIRRMNPVINLHLSIIIIILINSIENYGQGKTKLIAYVTTNKMVRTSNTLARNHSVIVNNNLTMQLPAKYSFVSSGIQPPKGILFLLKQKICIYIEITQTR